MKKHKTLFIIAIISIIFMSILIFYEYNGMFHKTPDKQYAYKTIQYIQNGWKIQIDGEFDLIDYNISDTSFRGDYQKYFIIKLKDEHQIQTLKTNQTQDTDFENEFKQAASLQENYNNIPDFTKEYTWKKLDKDNDSLFIVYFPQESILYIFESRI